MTDPRWPASMPAPLLADYGESVTPPMAVFEPDVGPPLVRLRGTVSRRTLNVTFRITTEQLATFEEFFEGEIASGALPFRMEHPRKQTDRRFRISFGQNDAAFSVSPKTPTIYDLKLRLLDIGP